MVTGKDIKALVDLLSNRQVHLYHACQYQDFLSYLQLDGIPSRSLLEKSGLPFTTFNTDVEDRVNGVWDKVFGNLEDFGAYFANGKPWTPVVYGPIQLVISPKTLLQAADVSIALRSAGVPDFDREAESLSNIGDVDRLFKFPSEFGPPESFLLKGRSDLIKEFKRAYVSNPEVSCTIQGEKIPLEAVCFVLVDPYEISGVRLSDLVKRAMLGSKMSAEVHQRIAIKSRQGLYGEIASLIEKAGDEPVNLSRNSDLSPELRRWKEGLSIKPSMQVDRFVKYLKEGTVLPVLSNGGGVVLSEQAAEKGQSDATKEDAPVCPSRENVPVKEKTEAAARESEDPSSGMEIRIKSDRYSAVEKSFRMKLRRKPSPMELEQVHALADLYGVNIFMLASKYSRETSLRSIAIMCMQLGGIPEHHVNCLTGMIYDTLEARGKYSDEALSTAIRLREASKPLDDEYLRSVRNPLTGNNAFQEWEEKIGRLYSSVSKMLSNSLKKYGHDMVFHAISAVEMIRIQANRLEFFCTYLKKLEGGDIDEVMGFLRLFLQSSKITVQGCPCPKPILIHRYFEAKTVRPANEKESRRLWELYKMHKTNTVIFAISCISSRDFDLDIVEYVCSDPYNWRKWNKPAYYPVDGWEYEYPGADCEAEEEGDSNTVEYCSGDESRVISFTEDFDEEPGKFAWTISDTPYDYSTHDPESLEGDEMWWFEPED